MIPDVQLLCVGLLADVSSASSINHHNGKLYLIGDDSTTTVILDTRYTLLDSLRLFNYPEEHIPKPVKIDLETSSLVLVNGKLNLLCIGSGSRDPRKKVLRIPLSDSGLFDHNQSVEFIDVSEFIKRFASLGIDEINIEGSAQIGECFILANRGTKTYPVNQFVVTDARFWNNPKKASLKSIQLMLSHDEKEFLGVSELCYVTSSDMLLLTISTENTSNSYDDGEIGDSYIGWIKNISTKLNGVKLHLDGVINLSNASEEFEGQKIEGICVESANDDNFLLHLVSDNDGSDGRIFNIELHWTI